MNGDFAPPIALQTHYLIDAHVLGEFQQNIEVFALVNPIPIDFDRERGFRDSISKHDQGLRLIILARCPQ